ncbi:hypothetical protein [Variovorax atrisoli]|uniref:hypothetical protein n=1 Tax=Variovorax atrisoli TaxID=3394203 RepID=UPI003395F685
MDDEIALKVTNHGGLEAMVRFAATWLIDVGVVSHAGADCVLLMPEDPQEIDLHDPATFDWFRTVVIESLLVAGLTGVSVAPQPTNPALEDVREL